MKEIKAFIRSAKAETVLSALESVGIDGSTLIDVMGLGAFADSRSAKYSVNTVTRFSQMAKIEVVCCDEDVHRVVEVLRSAAHTGLRGDGIIYVSHVDMAVKIRTGAVGADSLKSQTDEV
jgi:nitrogen regulatory protein P-II 1